MSQYMAEISHVQNVIKICPWLWADRQTSFQKSLF